MASSKDEKDEGTSTSTKVVDSDIANAARRRAGLTAGKGASSLKTPVKKVAAKPARKTIVTPGTKVSQATIDKIKSMGMTKALASAKNASPEMLEGLKRMYGAKRVGAVAPAKKGFVVPSRTTGTSKVNRGTPVRPVNSSKPKVDNSKVISTGGRGVNGVVGRTRPAAPRVSTPRKPEIISTGGRGVNGVTGIVRPKPTTKSTGKKLTYMDKLFGKK